MIVSVTLCCTPNLDLKALPNPLNAQSDYLSKKQIETYLTYASDRIAQNDNQTAVDVYNYLLESNNLNFSTHELVQDELEFLLPTEKTKAFETSQKSPEFKASRSLPTPTVTFDIENSERSTAQDKPTNKTTTKEHDTDTTENNQTRPGLDDYPANAEYEIMKSIPTDTPKIQKDNLEKITSTDTLFTDKIIRTGGNLPQLNLSVYAEDYDNQFPLYENTGYSGLSSTLKAVYVYSFNPLLSAKLALDFSVSTEMYSLSTTDAWLGIEIPDNDYHWHFTFGTQTTFDNRGWFYDATLDMISTQLSKDHWSWSFSVGRETLYYPFESGSEYPVHWISEFTRNWNGTNHLSLIFTSAHDNSYATDNTKSNFRWFGTQAYGLAWKNQLNRLDYWAQFGIMSGTETYTNDEANENPVAITSTRHRGWAFDVGTTLKTSFPGKPELTLSFANSSGDPDLDDGTVNHYRQPGIHSNSADIGSASGISYYGNALAPELSNLAVSSTGITFPLLTSSYISLYLRNYQQINATNAITNLSLDLPLTGVSRDIGQAIDVDISIWESPYWYTSLTLGFFHAGAAVEKPHPDIFYGLLEINRQF